MNDEKAICDTKLNDQAIRARAMHDAKLTGRQIATIMGVSLRVVHTLIARSYIAGRDRPLTALDAKEQTE